METEKTRKSLDVGTLRAQLQARAGAVATESGSGREYWRSLDELAQTEDFQELLHREFPEQASELIDPVSRRNFLRLMGASLALGGLSGCTIQPAEKIVPYVRAPEDLIPGKPLYFATAFELGGAATGILVESHMGRPTHIEGNPEHPGSLGSADAPTLASILDLYDPDRAKAVTNAGRISSWPSFLQAFSADLDRQAMRSGAGLRILTQTVTSPTLGHQLHKALEAFPEARWHQYEAVNRDNVLAGGKLAYGDVVNTYYDFSKADVILSIDADFAVQGPGSIRYAKDFAAGRKKLGDGGGMNRLYAVESSPSATGSIADHRLAITTGQIEAFTLSLAQRLGVAVSGGDGIEFDGEGWTEALARDLMSSRGRSIVIAGDQQAPEVHALAHAINESLGNVGTTVLHTDPLQPQPESQSESLADLVADMKADEVDMLVILGGNPAYDGPADLDFAGAMSQVGAVTYLGTYINETSARSHWHLPQSHYMEAWGDARAYDGTATIQQPLIEPLYSSRTALEIVAAINRQPGRPNLDLVREYWQANSTVPDFERFWQQSVHDGVIAGSAFVTRDHKIAGGVGVSGRFGKQVDEEGYELHVRPGALVWDGRFVNNGWLQETPDPITKLTWDNAALLSPATAERLGVSNEQVVQLSDGGRILSAPAWIVPGQADNVVSVTLGYGQDFDGRVGSGTGYNGYRLLTAGEWSSNDLKVNKTFDRIPLACTQDHHSMEGRHLVRHADLGDFEKHPTFAQEEGHVFPRDLTLIPDHEYNGNAWGMAIDLNSCIGCNACSVACQSENNIPIVGKEQVLVGRELSWIRIDRYFTDLDDPEIYHQPVPCQQCENAPCEVVCPVTATSHSAEGLNDMVYNRCVGTRYCSNNCPYKVRRFNFLQYADRETESLKLQKNPDVTVRARGVMEKCTYCVQRINSARIESKKSGTPIADGQIKTACQTACPTDCITFGDINDPKSEVGMQKASPRNYGILTELNTRPRTSYLARIRNPNPEILES